MATRYTARPQQRFGVPGLPTGYDTKSIPDITVPSVGLADVDKALFDLFDKEITLLVSGEGLEAKKVPVVFFAGEKWALNKKLRALRDNNGSLILPLVTAVRTSIGQDVTNDITGRGINQQTGEITVHRRLDKSDRGYQNLINRLLLNNQRGLGVNPPGGGTGLTTVRAVGDLAEDPVVQAGGLLVPDRRNNVYETIVVPAPQFFTAQYDVTLWTQYTSHMNQVLEALINSFLPQGNAWRLDTPKGYWFVATVDGNLYNARLNADDYSQTERLVRYEFVIKVPGYVMASSVPGAPVPIKRYVSAPTVSFRTEVGPVAGVLDDAVLEPFLGADDPTLPFDTDGAPLHPRRDQRRAGVTRLYPPAGEPSPHDPALTTRPRGTPLGAFQRVTGIDRSGNPVTRSYRVTSRNAFTGETVLAGDLLEGLTVVLTDG